jgi:hypothetical protein
VQEATSLPENRANTEHLERLRKEPEEREIRSRLKQQEELELERIWKKPGYEAEAAVLVVGVDDDEFGLGAVRAVDRALKNLKEREDRYEREMSVADAIAATRKQERSSAQEDLDRINQRLATVAQLLPLVQPLEAENPTPALIRRNFELLYSPTAFSLETLREYNINALPNTIVQQCIETKWEVNQDECLDVVDALKSAGVEDLSSILAKHVLPKLNETAQQWNCDRDPPLHLTFHPWLPYLSGILPKVLDAPKRVVLCLLPYTNEVSTTV